MKRNPVLESLSERILGRVAFADIKHPITGETLAKKRDLINEELCEKIDAAGVKTVRAHSVMTCISKSGVCIHSER